MYAGINILHECAHIRSCRKALFVSWKRKVGQAGSGDERTHCRHQHRMDVTMIQCRQSGHSGERLLRERCTCVCDSAHFESTNHYTFSPFPYFSAFHFPRIPSGFLIFFHIPFYRLLLYLLQFFFMLLLILGVDIGGVTNVGENLLKSFFILFVKSFEGILCS